MKQDKIMKFLAYNGKVNVVCASTTNLVEEARKTHDLGPTATAAFGRLLTMASIMGSDMKSEKDRLTIQLKGNGSIGMMIAVADKIPKVKGYVTNRYVDLPLTEDGKLDVGGAVGQEGFINVIKDIGLKEPYIGISPIVSGEIAEDFAQYFLTSQQQPTAVALGVLVDKNGVQSSGGYVITPMPDATEEDIAKMEQAIFRAGAISKMLAQNLAHIEIAKKITGDDNIQIIKEDITPSYSCDCSKEHIADGLISLGKEELEDIVSELGKVETVCHFCNQVYTFKKEELQELIEKIKKKKE